MVVTRLDVVKTFVRLSVPWAGFPSLFSTTYIRGCLFLAAHIGKTDTDQKTLDKWLQIALRNNGKTLEENGGERAKGRYGVESITPHEVLSYMDPAGAFLSSTLLPALLSLRHPHHPSSPKHTSLTFTGPITRHRQNHLCLFGPLDSSGFWCWML